MEEWVGDPHPRLGIFPWLAELHLIIKTPTLFLVGEKDFNVPALSSEQMYQALRSQGLDTQLVIYPGQFHGLRRPSFIRDRMQRYCDWYDARLKR